MVAYISNPIILMKLDMRGEGITGTESLGVHWYALNTKAKYEGLVAQQFERIVIECLFSLLAEQRVIHYQSKLVIAPLFFRVFVRSSEPHGTLPSASLYERSSGATHIRIQPCSSCLHDN